MPRHPSGYHLSVRLIKSRAQDIRPHLPAARMIFAPALEPPHPQVIFVILLKLAKAGIRHIRELDFGLFGGTARHASLCDVLLAGSCRLYHPVHRPIPPVKEPGGKMIGHVIDDARHLVSPQGPIIPSIGKKCMRLHKNVSVYLL